MQRGAECALSTLDRPRLSYQVCIAFQNEGTITTGM
jgi:hypothetical protein